MTRILLVEDDPGIGTGLLTNLKYENYEVIWVRDLRSAKQRANSEMFDLAILDVGLPDGTGFELCSHFRQKGLRWPIIMLTARTDENSVVEGLKAGANDYIRKPFGNRELLARIQTALGMTVSREDNLRFASLTISRERRKVVMEGIEIDLTSSEYDILLMLAENGSAVVSRQRLMERLDEDGVINDRTLDSHVSHIRKKMKTSGIKTLRIAPVYGVGYTLEPVAAV